MRLAITGADTAFGRAVAGAVAGEHTVRAIDLRFSASMPGGVETLSGDLRDRDFATSVTDGVDAVLHLAPIASSGTDDTTVIDISARGSFNLVDMAIEQGVSRFLLASSLSLFDRLPAEWRVHEDWRPRPEPSSEHLACWLSELSLRESCHTAAIRALCLRFGAIVTDSDMAGKPFDPRWLPIEDAVQAVRCGLRRLAEEPTHAEWEIYHISSGDRAKIRPHRARGEKFAYKPAHRFPEPAGDVGGKDPKDGKDGKESPDGVVQSGGDQVGRDWRVVVKPRPLVGPGSDPQSGGKKRVVIFGSGGPVAAALAEELKDDFILRQTDLRPLVEVRGENHPQSEGAPLPAILAGPHEERVVDVRDYSQVLAACEGMDAIVNCTVVRPDAVEAFRVNTLGAYNVMRAAIESGIRRVVQTGPQQIVIDGRAGYWWDYDVPGNVPARPGRHLYAHSKFLGQEICRVFAENYGLEVPVLVYHQFLNPEVTDSVANMAVSWRDSARALRRAIEVETLPTPYEEIAITSDLPHGRVSPQRAREVLGWEAQDDLSPLWSYRSSE